ncbi:MAG: capsule biosynthesis protein [Pseudomonadota bacterium]
MNTTPKAKKFRIRRTPGTPTTSKATPKASSKETPPEAMFEGHEDGFGDAAYPGSAKAEGSKPTPQSSAKAAEEMAEIKQEGLTGRQLRMARRLAQKNGLAPTSDYDAVRLLRAQGIDPFSRNSVLELVVQDEDQSAPKKPAAGANPSKLPQTVDPQPTKNLPGPAADPATQRTYEVQKIQKDIATRRRKRLAFLLARLFGFVLLPTLVALYYYAFIATPMYATKSSFVIQQADAQTVGGGGLLGGTALATTLDSIAAQDYLLSLAAMKRLDEDLGFKAHFSGDNIDRLQRLDPDATDDAAFRLFKRNVTVGYDPTEGILRLEVVAADPQVSAAFSEALISYAEENVDELTERKRADQMAGSEDSFKDAETKMFAAQARVLELQEQLGVLDPASETGLVMNQITTFEVQMAEKRLQLSQLLDNSRPNAARVSGVQGDIERLETLVASLRSQLTTSQSGNGSLAQITSQLRIAEVELETRTLMMQESLQLLESARIEASRQARYLSVGVQPTPPDEPAYPRVFENTMLAFLVFAGIYLMASLTASILREQVSG